MSAALALAPRFIEHVLSQHDGPLRYLEAGRGRPVVLIHGTLTTADEMAIALFDALSPRYRVIAFDRPGHGGSARRRLGGDPAEQAARLREGAQALGLERPILVGHSFGATVAQTYALEWPDEVAGLVAVAPLVLPELRMEHLIFGPRAPAGTGDIIAYGPGAILDRALLPLLWEMMFKPQPMPPAFREQFPFDLASTPAAMQSIGEDAVQAIPTMTRNLARLAASRLPIRILAGTADLVLDPMKHAGLLGMAAPRGRLRIEPGLGHMLHHFRPDLVAGAVDDLSR